MMPESKTRLYKRSECVFMQRDSYFLYIFRTYSQTSSTKRMCMFFYFYVFVNISLHAFIMWHRKWKRKQSGHVTWRRGVPLHRKTEILQVDNKCICARKYPDIVSQNTLVHNKTNNKTFGTQNIVSLQKKHILRTWCFDNAVIFKIAFLTLNVSELFCAHVFMWYVC